MPLFFFALDIFFISPFRFDIFAAFLRHALSYLRHDAASRHDILMPCRFYYDFSLRRLPSAFLFFMLSAAAFDLFDATRRLIFFAAATLPHTPMPFHYAFRGSFSLLMLIFRHAMLPPLILLRRCRCRFIISSPIFRRCLRCRHFRFAAAFAAFRRR